MQVKGREHSVRDVTLEVDPNDALKSITKTVYENLNLPTHDRLYVEDGVIVSYDDDGRGSHSSTERTIRNAAPTKQQIEAITHFNAIEKIVAINSVNF